MDKKNPGSFIKGVVDAGSKAVTGAINDVGKAATGAVKKVGEIRPTMPQISVEDVLRQTLKIPLVRIDRDKFLKKELSKICTEDVVALAIARNPAYAGIDRSTMDKIAQQAITYETNTATATSFTAGLPGGFAMAATIPADITQYFSHILRVMQKLAYCYGFDNFNLTDEEIDEETLNQIMTFLGVMFGVSGANQGVRALAEVAAKKVSRSLAQKSVDEGHHLSHSQKGRYFGGNPHDKAGICQWCLEGRSSCRGRGRRGIDAGHIPAKLQPAEKIVPGAPAVRSGLLRPQRWITNQKNNAAHPGGASICGSVEVP